ASSKYALPLGESPHCQAIPPVPLIVGSQNRSAALKVVLASAMFSSVGSATATAATSSSIGYDDHTLATWPSAGHRLSYQPFFGFHQRCCICTSPCSANCWYFAWLAARLSCEGSDGTTAARSSARN